MEYTPSRFIQKTLMPDERCVKDARFSWLYTAQAWLFLLLFLAIGVAVHFALFFLLRQFTYVPIYAGAFVGFGMFLSMMAKKWTTEIILTNQRLIYKQGFFSVNVAEVDIEQLASDKVEQSLLGRMLDYGVIQVRCIEADDIILPPISKPYEFRNALEQQKHLYRENYMKVERIRRHGHGNGHGDGDG